MSMGRVMASERRLVKRMGLRPHTSPILNGGCKHEKITWLVLGWLALSFTAQAASFDCAKAGMKVEKLICGDAALSKLDEQLAVAYQQALAATMDKDALKRQQQEWLTKTRDACHDSECLKNAYSTRFKVLGITAFTKKGMGLYRCSGKGVNFEIRDGIITDFYSASVVSSPDFANGYTKTCAMYKDDFYQTKGGEGYVLQFNSPDDQYGESLNCQVHIENFDSKFHARSLNCLSECMKFDFEVNKNGKDCYHEP